MMDGGVASILGCSFIAAKLIVVRGIAIERMRDSGSNVPGLILTLHSAAGP